MRNDGINGATLIDTIIGVFVFSIIFISTMAGLRYSSSIKVTQNEKTIAISIIQYICEDIHTLEFSTIPEGYPSFLQEIYTTQPKMHPDFKKLNNARLNIKVTKPCCLDVSPYSTCDNLKKIEIILSWVPSNTSSQNIKINMYLASPIS